MNLLIGLSVGAYIAWKVVSPLPASENPCTDPMGCARPTLQTALQTAPRTAPKTAPRTAPPGAPGQGLRIELYDPGMEPLRRYADEAPHTAWISSAENDAASALLQHAAVRRQGVGFSVIGLGKPGAQGICLVPDGGRRHCVTFTKDG